MRLPVVPMVAAVVIATAVISAPALPAPAPGDTPWSASDPRLAAEARAGSPIVTFLHVPLCSNRMIDCGSEIAGRAGDPSKNIYWGAIFGARRFFERRTSPWIRVEERPWNGSTERVVYRLRTGGRAWGIDREVETLVVLQATHGDAIDSVVDDFWKTATQGGTVTFRDGGRERSARISAVGYAGHNRLMDGKRLPAVGAGGAPIPSFVVACKSEPWFGPSLRQAGSVPLLTTRELMAPEGYVLDAVARSMAANGSARAIRRAAIDAYRSWQRIEERQAAWVFAP